MLPGFGAAGSGELTPRLRPTSQAGKDSRARGEWNEPMTKHLAQAGIGVLAFAFRTSRDLEWYVVRRLQRPA